MASIAEEQVSRSNDFPDDNDQEEFPEDMEEGDMKELFKNVISWGDVKQNTWLKIIEKHPVHTIHGKTAILEMQQRDHKIITAWATNIICNGVSSYEIKKAARGGNIFIKPKD